MREGAMTAPVGYLVTVALAAWCTFFAVVAPRRPLLVGRVSWLFGMLINELPFLAIYYLVASTALAAGRGRPGLAEWQGRRRSCGRNHRAWPSRL
ncbi:hypothetical protein, partial [Nocardioides alcanivorans]|uniref:hypothetical protein n=1 Tax=Nocardioides alcanivorans TaxID=2897352 RepID=UPI001F1736A3